MAQQNELDLHIDWLRKRSDISPFELQLAHAWNLAVAGNHPRLLSIFDKPITPFHNFHELVVVKNNSHP
jgi:hypothetical protein